MKILVFSDLHLHNWNYGSTIVDGMNSRLMDQAAVFDQMSEYCVDNVIDQIVFCGDLFHTHGKLDASVLKVAYEGVYKLAGRGVPMVFIVGNHDTADKNKRVHSLHWLEAFKDLTVVDSTYHSMATGISYLSYTEDKEELQKFFKMAQPLCFMHQGIASVPMGSGFLINEILTLDMIPDNIDHVYTGHYHSCTKASYKATIVGTPLQLTWADEGDTRGFLVVDTEKGEHKHIEIDAPKFKTFTLHTTDESEVEGNFLRVKNYEKNFYTVEDIREELMRDGARSVEFVPQEVEGKRLEPLNKNGFHLPTLVSEYEKQQDISPECSTIGKGLMK